MWIAKQMPLEPENQYPSPAVIVRLLAQQILLPSEILSSLFDEWQGLLGTNWCLCCTSSLQMDWPHLKLKKSLKIMFNHLQINQVILIVRLTAFRCNFSL